MDALEGECEVTSIDRLPESVEWRPIPMLLMPLDRDERAVPERWGWWSLWSLGAGLSLSLVAAEPEPLRGLMLWRAFLSDIAASMPEADLVMD